MGRRLLPQSDDVGLRHHEKAHGIRASAYPGAGRQPQLARARFSTGLNYSIINDTFYILRALPGAEERRSN